MLSRIHCCIKPGAKDRKLLAGFVLLDRKNLMIKHPSCKEQQNKNSYNGSIKRYQSPGKEKEARAVAVVACIIE
jgi:hypothetical protein